MEKLLKNTLQGAIEKLRHDIAFGEANLDDVVLALDILLHLIRQDREEDRKH